MPTILDSYLQPSYLGARTLHSSMAGCTDGADIVGTCPRAAIANYLGFQDPAQQGYYFAGLGLEREFGHRLERTHTVVHQPDLSHTRDGFHISAHPDFFVDAEYGIEHKAVLGRGLARSVSVDHLPRTKDVCQAAYYQLMLGKPFTIIYNSPLKWGSVDPFYGYFKIRLKPDNICYTGVITNRHGEVKWHGEEETELSTTGIHDYFGLLIECITAKDFGFGLTEIDILGKPTKYDHSLYCTPCQLLEESKGWDEWTAKLAAKTFTNNLDR